MHPAVARSSVAIVTGGSRGIGRAVVEALVQGGCGAVAVNYRSADASVVKLFCDRIGAAYPGVRLLPVRADCSREKEVEHLFQTVGNELGPVDVLVNNAGIKHDAIAVKMKHADFLRVIDVNLSSTYLCSRAAISAGMLRARRGRIINIASVSGQMGSAGQANYAAAKAGILGLTRSLAREYAARGICVNAVSPGYIDGTDMTADLAERQRVQSSIPMQRFGTPKEVAGLVQYLALHPSAAYITGHTFNIDGGLAIGAT